MANEWILDVLTDLATFAEKNGMLTLERQLILASEAAEADMGVDPGISLGTTGQGAKHVGIVHRATAGGGNA